jgi:hypothetical protein
MAIANENKPGGKNKQGPLAAADHTSFCFWLTKGKT